jgi:hypothetical protein
MDRLSLKSQRPLACLADGTGGALLIERRSRLLRVAPVTLYRESERT